MWENMGQKDVAEKVLEAYNDVFSDIVNVLLFDGRQVVKEDELTDAVPLSQYKADGKLHSHGSPSGGAFFAHGAAKSRGTVRNRYTNA